MTSAIRDVLFYCVIQRASAPPTYVLDLELPSIDGELVPQEEPLDYGTRDRVTIHPFRGLTYDEAGWFYPALALAAGCDESDARRVVSDWFHNARGCFDHKRHHYARRHHIPIVVPGDWIIAREGCRLLMELESPGVQKQLRTQGLYRNRAPKDTPRTTRTMPSELAIAAHMVGIFTRVAREMKKSPAHVLRVAKGQRVSKAVAEAIVKEVRRVLGGKAA